MQPVLFYIGSTPVFSYGVFILIGLMALFAIALKLARQDGLSWEEITPITLGVFFGGVVGSRLSHVLVEPDRAAELLDFYGIFRPGIPGNIVGLMIGGYIGGMLIRERLGLPSMSNQYVVGMAAAGVIWRIGCTLAGCCYGVETESPLHIVIENVQRQPTMIYEGLFNLVMLGVVWRLRPLARPDDGLLFFYFACYAFFRFWLEFIRVYPAVFLGLTGIQWLCLGSLVVLAGWFWHNHSFFAIFTRPGRVTP